ncbi:hypothetical protein KPA07_06370 [Corynebacterium aurimucosum]|uniref:hypothetical protein n=1 Tax=Corynebacterium aurimucosum TaxID=169292 RepID=UPI001C0EFEFA|nr:hypothetical protein [Corynebacterium aurimucosum]MBU5654537.1 hypothetical protein [Corynebacterium aurimucosum]
MTTSSIEPGYKYVTRRDDSPTASDTRGGIGFGPIAEAFGKLLNGVVETIGKVLGGAAELAVGAFQWILSGVRNVLTTVFQTLGAIFSKDPDDVVPDFVSPIRADLEAAVKPMFDRIDENNKAIDDAQGEIQKLLAQQRGLTAKYEEVLQGQTKIRQDQTKVNDEIKGQVASLKQATDKVSKTVDDLVAFKDGMDARIAEAMEQMRTNLNLAGELKKAKAEVEKKISDGLSKGGSLASKVTALTAAPDGKSFAEFWQERGQQIIKMQSWYNDWNNGQWKLQTEWNDLQTNWNARVTATLNEQVKINSDQTTFNGFVKDFVKVQKWYNENNDSLWKLQQAFNDKTTGWQAKQEELNTLNTDFQREQTATSEQFDTILKRLRMNQDELAQIAREQAEFIFRKLVAQRNGTQATENEHWIVRPDRGELTAKGSWSGEASVRVYRTEIDNDLNRIKASSEELYPIPLSDGSRTINVGKSSYDSTTHTIAVDYSVARGRRIIEIFPDGSPAGEFTPTRGAWVTLNTFTVRRTTVHRFSLDVVWKAATFHNRYGVRVTRNGSLVASVGPRDGVGPLTPLGNGVRTMSIDEQSVSFTKGDKVAFQVFSTGDTAAQRTLRTWTRTVSYMSDPKE